MLRYFGVSVLLTAVALVAAVLFGGPAALLAVAVLGVLELSLSFDNAVVNAKVLRRMSPLWRRLFLYVGIFIAVFGMRLLLPIVLVAVTAGLSIPEVWHLALTDSGAYAAKVDAAAPAIYTFGGIFLLMIFLNFLFDEERELHWLVPIERRLAKGGKLPYLEVVIAIGVVYAASQLVPSHEYATVLLSGIAGLGTYLLIGGLNELMAEPGDGGTAEAAPARTGTAAGSATSASTSSTTRAVAGAGLAGFLYLEVLDASFSFDGVIGAFALSNDIFVIALGLGIGAFWVRSLTIFMVDKGTLEQYRYLEHGAMWAIGVLAGIMILKLQFHISEYVTGPVGLVLIVAAVLSSLVAQRREEAAATREKEMVGVAR